MLGPEYFFAWMMVFLRSIGIIIQLPMIAGRTLPVILRVGFGICLATLLAGLVPSAAVPGNLWGLGFAAAGEVALGLMMGFVMRLTFEGVNMAGRIASSEIGLSATPGIGVPEPTTEPVADLFSSFSIVAFFLLRGHQMLLTAFARSFQLAAAGRAALDPAAAEVLISATSHSIELGVRMAAPFIAMNFLITLAFSVLGRAVPKMNAFVVSFSVRVLAGLGLLSAAGALLMRYLSAEFVETQLRMLQVLPLH